MSKIEYLIEVSPDPRSKKREYKPISPKFMFDDYLPDFQNLM